MRTSITKTKLIGLLLALPGWPIPSAAQIDGCIHLSKPEFQIEYRPDLGVPAGVFWSVSREDIGNAQRSPSWRFKTDKETPKPRVKSNMYLRSGFQRGHMCPAADRSANTKLMRSTFIMSNVCPMTQALNTGAWKRWEEKERRIAREKGQCFVIAAPIFFPIDTTWIGDRHVAVPHAFLKIIYGHHPDTLYGMALIENR